MFFFKKNFNYNLLAIFAGILFVLLFILKVHPESILVTDNQKKIIQAQAFVDSNFQSEYSSCPVLEDLGGCAYYHRGRGDKPKRIVGVFPVAFSLVAAVFGKLGDYCLLYYFELVLFVTSIFILKFRSGINWIGVSVLTFSPCFFHSMLFPDYAITFLLTTLLVSFYDKPSSSIFGNILVGFFSGLVIFFRPENIFLPFFLGFFQLLTYFTENITESNVERRNRLFQLISSGIVVIIFALVNYYLYDTIFGSRITGNAKTLLTQEANKALSLLFFGNGRIGFLTFLPWIVLALVFLTLKFRSLEKKEKMLLGSSIASLLAVVITAPNDSNIDWGTRYLSWIVIPISLLCFSGNSMNILLSYGRKIRIAAIVLFSLNLLISFAYLFIQAQISKEFLKYNAWLKGQKTEISILQQAKIESLYGQEILRRKVLFPNRKSDPKKFAEFVTSKASKVDLVRYEPSTLALLEAQGGPAGESDYVPGADYRLEKEFISLGWKQTSKQGFGKIEIVTLER